MPNSPNMLLPIPVVGTTIGPTFAYDVNDALTLIDQHDHSPGKGVQLTPGSLNINAALSLNNNFLTDVAGVTFEAQSSTPGVGTMYENGVDLYYVDGLGNNIRITQSGAVAGTPGSIANLVAPASASYVAGNKTFVWQSGTNLAANMDAASYILRNISPNSTFGVTLQPPAALGSNWSLTVPPIPSDNSFMQLTTSGVITAAIPLSHGLTDANIALGTQIAAIIQSVTTTASVNFTSNVVLASTAAAYTLTMYTAVGNGQTVKIKKTSSDYNALTISLVGGSTTTTTLNTQDEEITLTSNGTDWIIVSRNIPSVWVAGTFGVAGGLASTGPASQNSFVKRIGDSLHCRVAIVLGNTSAATGTVTLPSSLTIDTAKLAAGSTPGSIVGQSVCSRLSNLYETGSRRQEVAVTSGGGSVYLSVLGSGGTLGSLATINSVFGGGDGLHMDFLVPISGWNG